MQRSDFYCEYKAARNKAWEIIIKYEVNTLPVSVRALCRRMGICLFKYTEGASLIEKYKLHKYLKNDGFSTIIQNNYIVFYDETKPVSRIRFTIAHEIGHIVLKHLLYQNIACRHFVTDWNAEGAAAPNPLETAANIFASRLLAPACVLWKLNIHSAEEIETLCGLSRQAAQIRAQRMERLYLLNRFNQSPLEKKTLQQFSGFIEEYQKAHTLQNNI